MRAHLIGISFKITHHQKQDLLTSQLATDQFIYIVAVSNNHTATVSIQKIPSTKRTHLFSHGAVSAAATPWYIFVFERNQSAAYYLCNRISLFCLLKIKSGKLTGTALMIQKPRHVTTASNPITHHWSNNRFHNVLQAADGTTGM